MTTLDLDFAVNFPPALVFATFRDHIPDLLPLLPGIERIEVLSRGVEADADVVNTCLRFHARTAVPRVLRGMLGESLFFWTDRARWDARALACDWHTETAALGGGLRCGARDMFLEHEPGKTTIQIRGALEVDPARLPGVPGFLAPQLARALESFLVSKVQADLKGTMAALSRYLETSVETRPAAAFAHARHAG